MSTTVNLGKVVGDDASINGNVETTVTAGYGVTANQTGKTFSLEPNFDEVQRKVTGEPNQLLGFDEEGNAVPVPAGYELYGFELNMDETYGPNMVRYIEQNVNFEPAHMDYTNGVFDYGDWADAWFIKNLRPCMLRYNGSVAYDLKKDDYTKKIDGTASDVANDGFDGNAMVGIPTVWVKVDTSVSRKPKFYFSNRQLDSSFKAYAHHDDNGDIMPYTYMAIYNGWVDTNGRLRSISGKAPTGRQTGSVQLSEARANNIENTTEWDIGKFVDRVLINLLLILIGKTTDSQAAFGYGNANGGVTPATGSGDYGILNSGTMDTAGLFTGADDDPGNTGVKVFGIENYWGNVWSRVMGLVVSNRTMYYKLTKGTEDGSTVVGFDESIMDSSTVPTGWKELGEGPSSAGYISDMHVGEYGLAPSSTEGGDSDRKYYDKCWITSGAGLFVALMGGGTSSNYLTGINAFSMDDLGSYLNYNRCAVLSCKPNVGPNRDNDYYGFQLNLDKSTPSEMITYFGKNAGFKAAKMDYTNSVFDYGDWGDAWFIKNLRPCMLNYNGTVAYNLDKNDYSKKADGTASDVANQSFAGNAMVGIPTVWIKVDTKIPRKPKFYFADHKIDPSYHAYAHHDDNGNIMPYTYMPAYNGYKDSSNRLRSISGVSPTRFITGTDHITYARNNNPSGSGIWDIEKFVDRQLINLLLLLIGKSTDTQTVFGFGNGRGYNYHATGSDSYGVLPTGTLNDKGMFYGYTGTLSSGDNNLAVKVFGIENWWGNISRRNMGLILSAGTYYYKLTKGTEDGSTVSGFNTASIADSAGTPTGWIRGGTIDGGSVSSSDIWYGVPEDMYVGDFGLLDKTYDTADDKTKNFCDRSYRRITQNRSVLYGGDASAGFICGAFYCDLSVGLSPYGWTTGASPSCKPNV